MTTLRHDDRPVDSGNPLPVILPSAPKLPNSTPYTADFILQLALQGQIFIYGDGDQNDMVTGQTSFANTLATWCLDVPADVIAIPLYIALAQAGTVAGDVINVLCEYDRIKRFSSGTEETSKSTLTSPPYQPKSKLYSTATVVAGYYQTFYRTQLGPDVSPAEGVPTGLLIIPVVPILLAGPASMLVYTNAGTTGPSWLWNICIAEVPRGWIL